MMDLDVGSLARAYTPAMIATLGGWATNDKTAEDVRLRAITILLDRGYGRPKQDNTHELKGEVRVILRKMLTDEEEDE